MTTQGTKSSNQLWKEYYSIQDAANLLGKDPDEFIYRAVKGEITIYIKANNWVAQRIYEVDHKLDGLDQPIRFVRLLGAPATTDFTNPRLYERLRESTCPEMEIVHESDYAVTIIGSQKFHPKNGMFKQYFSYPTSIQLPVTVDSLNSFLKTEGDAKVEISLNKILPQISSPNQFVYCPNEEITVTEAYEQGRLHVSTSEIQEAVDVVSNENEVAGVSKNTLLKIVATMAVKGYCFNPNQNNSATAEILRDMSDLVANPIKKTDTILNAIKLAIETQVVSGYKYPTKTQK